MAPSNLMYGLGLGERDSCNSDWLNVLAARSKQEIRHWVAEKEYLIEVEENRYAELLELYKRRLDGNTPEQNSEDSKSSTFKDYWRKRKPVF